MYKLGLWLRRKVLLCGEKLKEAENVLSNCGFSQDVLRREWEAQIKAQTKPLPRKLSFLHCIKGYMNDPLKVNTRIEGNLL